MNVIARCSPYFTPAVTSNQSGTRTSVVNIYQVSAEMSPGGNQDDEKIWYFAYGSNMRSSGMSARGIVPLMARAVVVPSCVLCFDIFGIPYSEPAFASIRPRDDHATTDTKADHVDIPPVHGVAYLLSNEGYRRLVLTEGAGVGYDEIVVTTLPADPSSTSTAHDHDQEIKVHTLKAKYPFRPNRAPSARYLVSCSWRASTGQVLTYSISL
jgi:hypothetical protein